MRKTNQEEFRIEKLIKKKGNKLYVKWKGYNYSTYNYSYNYEPFGGDINVKVDLSNSATKVDLKDATGIDISNFALKSNLASLKTVVKNDVVKKTIYDKLVAKVNNIDTTEFVLNTKYETDKSDLQKKISDADKKISDTINLVEKKDLNVKVSEIESKILNITGLATNSALIAVENKILDVSSLTKKTDYDAKILDIEKKVTDHDHDESITTSKFNNLTTENFKARLVQANLVTKVDFDARLISLNKKN